MILDMRSIKIEPTRFAVSQDGHQIGMCVNMSGVWSFFCNLDNSVTKGPTADIAIASKVAKSNLKMPDDSGSIKNCPGGLNNGG